MSTPRAEEISTALARDLRDAGLTWQPSDGDRFAIPERGLDDRRFTVSEMVVEVRDTPAGPVMAFNGTTEWALDAILQREVIWLPREDQLRLALGPAFDQLVRTAEGYRCTVALDDHPVGYDGPTAAEAYGRALLHRLRHG